MKSYIINKKVETKTQIIFKGEECKKVIFNRINQIQGLHTIIGTVSQFAKSTI